MLCFLSNIRWCFRCLFLCAGLDIVRRAGSTSRRVRNFSLPLPPLYRSHLFPHKVAWFLIYTAMQESRKEVRKIKGIVEISLSLCPWACCGALPLVYLAIRRRKVPCRSRGGLHYPNNFRFWSLFASPVSHSLSILSLDRLYILITIRFIIYFINIWPSNK